MPEKPARNAPCPCGSGKKFKRCHGLTGEALGEAAKRPTWLLITLLLLAVGVGIAVGFARDWQSGLGAAGGVVFVSALYLVFRNPPPPNAGSGDPAGLNFGR